MQKTRNWKQNVDTDPCTLGYVYFWPIKKKLLYQLYVKGQRLLNQTFFIKSYIKDDGCTTLLKYLFKFILAPAKPSAKFSTTHVGQVKYMLRAVKQSNNLTGRLAELACACIVCTDKKCFIRNFCEPCLRLAVLRMIL